MTELDHIYFWRVDHLYKRRDGNFCVVLKPKGASSIERLVTPSEAAMIDIGMMLGIQNTDDGGEDLYRPLVFQKIITKVVPLISKETTE